jgi:hypothetical protein
MKIIKKIVLLQITLLSNIICAHPFSCANLIRRFGPNSYITRIPLFFEPTEKRNNNFSTSSQSSAFVKNSSNKSHKAGTAGRVESKKHKTMNA